MLVQYYLGHLSLHVRQVTVFFFNGRERHMHGNASVETAGLHNKPAERTTTNIAKCIF